ncbi:MAG: hypothetical protein SOY88_03025, partial [Massilioclostridium sp.]|nr:hypothetical protein [Massilioclostridium sp.]
LDEVEGSAFKAGGFKLLGKSVCHFKHPFFLRTTLERKGNIVYNIDVPLPFRQLCDVWGAVLSFDGRHRSSFTFRAHPLTSECPAELPPCGVPLFAGSILPVPACISHRI